MATGYTAGVADGTITTFREYALQCARAFGACVTLRDDPLNAEIAESQPSDYHEKALAEAEVELAAFVAMDESDLRQMHDREYEENVASATRTFEEKELTLQRYKSMLAAAKAFRPPSPEHEEYAKFLVSQLQESIRWDCDASYWNDLSHWENLKTRVPLETWVSEKLARLRWTVDYHRKHHREELERTAARNNWVAQLKEALWEVE